jgi:hypothetical protein
MNTSVSPLSPKGEGERESICALFKSCVQLGISSRRHLHEHLGQSPLPQGRGGKGVDLCAFSNLAFNSVFQVGVTCMNTSVSPLSPKGEGEREPICGLFKSCVQLGISSRRYLHKHLGQSPLPQGRGGKGADLWAFQILRSTRHFKSALLAQTPRSVPSPSGRGLG